MLAGTVAATSVIGLVGTSDSAAAEQPKKLLQVVHVGIGSDGSIDSISRSDIAQDDRGYHSSADRLDPSKKAGDLPVSVSTVYSHNGRSGTDLADLGGVTGQVTVGVTVSNRTARTAEIDYVSGGRSLKTTGLVAAPMTVVATAEIPRSAVGSISTAQQRTLSGMTTNGTVATLPNGDYAVQWAAILAPPVLSPSATFQLVLDAKKFKMAGISIDVEPGVTADPSLRNLVNSQFGSASPLQGLENNTISLIGSVQTQLLGVQSNLASIRSDLSEQVQTHGAQAVSTLRDSGRRIAGSVAQLKTELNSLKTSLRDKLLATSGQAQSSFNSALTQVIQTIGVDAGGHTSRALPGGQPSRPSVSDNNCEQLKATSATRGLTLYGQLDQVQTLLTSLGKVSTKCLRNTLSDLDTQIASISSAKDCTRNVALSCLQDDLTALTNTVNAALGARVGRSRAAFDATRQAVVQLGTALREVTCAARVVDPKGITATPADGCTASGTDLDTVTDALGKLAGLGDDSSPVSSALDGLADKVSQTYTTLRDLVNDREDDANTDAAKLKAGAREVESAACATPENLPADAELDDYVDAVQKAAGVDCENGKPAKTDANGLSKLADRNADAVRDLLAGAKTALTALAPTSAGDSATIRQAIKKIRGTVDDLQGDAKSALSKTAGTNGNSLKQSIAGLLDKVDQLGDVSMLIGTTTPQDASACGADATPGTTPAAVLHRAFLQSSCTAYGELTGMAHDVSDAAVQASGKVDQAKTNVGRVQNSVDRAGDTAVNNLGRTLDGVAQSQFELGTTSLRDGAVLFTENSTAASDRVGKDTRENIANLNAIVDRANGDQAVASRTLSGQVDQVLLALGSVKGTGILGGVTSSASKVGGGAAEIGAASNRNSSYTGVRRAQVAAGDIAQRQQQLGVEQALAYAPFGQQLPKGSTRSSVFVLDLGAVG